MRELKADALFRPVFEGKAAIAWAVALVWVLLLAIVTRLSGMAMGMMLLFATAMMARRYCQAAKVWGYKVRLSGAAIDMLSTAQINAIKPQLQDNLWLGWGWEWQPSHTQQAYDILKRDSTEIYPPNWFLKLNGIAFDPRTLKGRQWVHGLGDEKDVVMPFSGLAGHTAIAATTGAIKTTLYKLMVYQFALAGDVVIIIDPKGDKDLYKIAKDAAAACGDPSRFISFHPAFPSKGVRFDGLKNWERESQVASRITQIISAGEEGNNFIDFCWQVITSIVACMKIIGRRPTIAAILDHIRALENSEKLCEDVLVVWLTPRIENLSTVLQDKMRSIEAAQAKGGKSKSSFAEKAEPRLLALIAFFKEYAGARPSEIDSLIGNLESNREWFGKMIVALTPTLTKLSTGDLRGMLSPDYEDPNDMRPIYDMGKVIREKKIFYIGTDALSDQSVAAAIAAFGISDLAAEAGTIYNYSDPKVKRPRVHLLIDEAANALCAPLIEICNKGRGAGIHVYLAFQAFSDIVTKMGGDVNAAKRFMANMNNLIVGATQDTDTLDIISDKFGEVDVVSASRSQGSGQKTEDVGLEYSATKGVSFSEKNRVMIPRSVLMSMPDLQYVAVVNRAKIYKGRIPVLEFNE